ncbi:MAG: hypothetical protein AAF961_17880, partial [Planctomycetota bacterium]
TTLITAVVIYKIAPDNVKGFGVTLILGILMSMYSAIFLSRLIFDVAERMRWLKALNMGRIVGETAIDFLSKRHVAGVLSSLVIIVGMFGVFSRGRDLLNIDFTGGSSVTLVLDEDQKMEYAAVKEFLNGTELADENLSLVEVGDTNTRYTVTTVNQNVEEVQQILADQFDDRLKKYRVEIGPLTALPGGEAASRRAADEAYVDRRLTDPSVPLSHVLMQADEKTSETVDASADDSAGGAPTDNEAGNAPDDASGAEAVNGAPQGDGDPAVESPATGGDGATSDAAPLLSSADDLFAGGTSATLRFGVDGDMENSGVSRDTLQQLMDDALLATDHEGISYELFSEEYDEGTARRFAEWQIKIALPEAEAQEVFEQLQDATNSRPVFPLANKIGGRVAGR